MKKILLLMSIFISNVYAIEIEQVCATDPLTSTFIFMSQDNDYYSVDLYHHNGVRYLPLHYGVITPNDLSLLETRGKLLMELGESLKFRMLKKNCNSIDRFNFSCFGSDDEVMINGHKVVMWGFYSALEAEKSFAGKYDYIVVSMALEIDGETIYVPMKYSYNDCYDNALKAKTMTKHRLDFLFAR